LTAGPLGVGRVRAGQACGALVLGVEAGLGGCRLGGCGLFGLHC